MAISIKNGKAEELAREVAAATGESLTDAVIHSLEERRSSPYRRCILKNP